MQVAAINGATGHPFVVDGPPHFPKRLYHMYMQLGAHETVPMGLNLLYSANHATDDGKLGRVELF